MVEYRWFAVGILMMYVIVSEILVLPVIWPPSWIYGAHRCPMTSAVALLKSVRGSRWNFLAMCSRTRDMPGGIFTPPPLLVNVAKKPLPGQGLNLVTYPKYTTWNVEVSTKLCLYFYRATHYSAKCGLAIACRPSVCLSVRLSVRL